LDEEAFCQRLMAQTVQKLGGLDIVVCNAGRQQAKPSNASEKKYENFGSTTVFGRPGQPAELASIYVQLAADDASFATGNIYGAGGGQGQP
jgi:NAD(P)-dependent dehydrogenase (short-subunit alcohol dehydrogenase family)